MPKLPEWFKTKTRKGPEQKKIRDILKNDNIHTVCESAKCPNRGECFNSKTVTFMILGNSCTRNCTFCAVPKGSPYPIDNKEPEYIFEAIKKLGIKYAVITSVTRDDLEDGGANQFKEVIKHIKNNDPQIKTEVLTPDFQGNLGNLSTVLKANPDVFNHNIETIKKLYPQVRPMADYNMSLSILKYAKDNYPHIRTKTGIMVGMGETTSEVKETLKDIAENNVDIVTIGQYLRPSTKNYEVREYIHPDIFDEYARHGEELGLKVISGPFVRSSYKALEISSYEDQELMIKYSL